MAEEKEPIQYPAKLLELGVSRELAEDALVEWILEGFRRASEPPPPPSNFIEKLMASSSLSLPWQERPKPPVIDHNHPARTDLGTSNLLAYWIYVASRDPGIAKDFGQSDFWGDDPFWMLQRESISLLNDLLARHFRRKKLSSPDDDQIRAAVSSLWDGLSSGFETYEVGAWVFGLVIDRTVGEIPLTDGVTLKPIVGDWARERFPDARNATGQWRAICAQVKRRWTPASGADNVDTGPADGELLERGLRLLQLAHPMASLISIGLIKKEFVTFRIGVSGHREPPKVDEHTPQFGAVSRARRKDIRMSADAIRALRDLTALVGACAPVREAFDESATDRLALAIRAYHMACSSRRWQDRILDLGTAYEALIGRVQNEITYTLKMRTATLVGRTPEEAASAFDVAEALYDLRSRIIHGDAPDAVQKSAAALIRKRRGQNASLPKDHEAQGRVAATIGAELVSQIVRAFMHLKAAETAQFKPLDTTSFVKQLDRATYDPAERRRFQKLAGIG